MNTNFKVTGLVLAIVLLGASGASGASGADLRRKILQKQQQKKQDAETALDERNQRLLDNEQYAKLLKKREVGSAAEARSLDFLAERANKGDLRDAAIVAKPTLYERFKAGLGDLLGVQKFSDSQKKVNDYKHAVKALKIADRGTKFGGSLTARFKSESSLKGTTAKEADLAQEKSHYETKNEALFGSVGLKRADLVELQLTTNHNITNEDGLLVSANASKTITLLTRLIKEKIQAQNKNNERKTFTNAAGDKQYDLDEMAHSMATSLYREEEARLNLAATTLKKERLKSEKLGTAYLGLKVKDVVKPISRAVEDSLIINPLRKDRDDAVAALAKKVYDEKGTNILKADLQVLKSEANGEKKTSLLGKYGLNADDLAEFNAKEEALRAAKTETGYVRAPKVTELAQATHQVELLSKHAKLTVKVNEKDVVLGAQDLRDLLYTNPDAFKTLAEKGATGKALKLAIEKEKDLKIAEETAQRKFEPGAVYAERKAAIDAREAAAKTLKKTPKEVTSIAQDIARETQLNPLDLVAKEGKFEISDAGLGKIKNVCNDNQNLKGSNLDDPDFSKLLVAQLRQDIEGARNTSFGRRTSTQHTLLQLDLKRDFLEKHLQLNAENLVLLEKVIRENPSAAEVKKILGGRNITFLDFIKYTKDRIKLTPQVSKFEYWLRDASAQVSKQFTFSNVDFSELKSLSSLKAKITEENTKQALSKKGIEAQLTKNSANDGDLQKAAARRNDAISAVVTAERALEKNPTNKELKMDLDLAKTALSLASEQKAEIKDSFTKEELKLANDYAQASANLAALNKEMARREAKETKDVEGKDYTTVTIMSAPVQNEEKMLRVNK